MFVSNGEISEAFHSEIRCRQVDKTKDHASLEHYRDLLGDQLVSYSKHSQDTKMSIILLIIGALCCILILKIISILHEYYIDLQRYRNIPNTHALPIFGDSLTLIRMTEPERVSWFDSLVYRFKEGIFMIWIGTKPIIVIYKPEYLEAIFPSTVNIEKGEPYEILRPWLGNGLLTSTGTQWFHDRRIIGPTFHFSILDKFAVILSEKAQILIKCLEKEIEKNQGEAIDFFPFATKVSLDIICETAMGMNIHAQETTSEYCLNVNKISKLILYRFFQPWLWHDWIYHMTSTGKEHKRLLDKLHGFTKEVINKKKTERLSQTNPEEPANEVLGSDTDKQKRKAFLDLLLDQNELDNSPLSDNELRAQVDTFMFEGHDTTAVAITWTLFCLGNSLEHQEKLHEELEEVFKDSQTPATLKELSQLKYLDRVIKETLRLFPSVPMIARKLKEDVKLDDYNITKGTTVILGIFFAHRSHQVWPDPLKFDPDRFLPENSKHRNPYAYVPFSAGPRNCIGQKFALLEEKIVLTAILRKWRVRNLKTADIIKSSVSLIFRPEEEISIHFTPKI